MTLEEIVKHVEQVAYNNNDEALVCMGIKEYRELAGLLRELAERRKAPEIIYCKDCTRRRKNTETGEYYCRASGLRNTDYDFCSGGKRAERRTE